MLSTFVAADITSPKAKARAGKQNACTKTRNRAHGVETLLKTTSTSCKRGRGQSYRASSNGLRFYILKICIICTASFKPILSRKPFGSKKRRLVGRQDINARTLECTVLRQEVSNVRRLHEHETGGRHACKPQNSHTQKQRRRHAAGVCRAKRAAQPTNTTTSPNQQLSQHPSTRAHASQSVELLFRMRIPSPCQVNDHVLGVHFEICFPDFQEAVFPKSQ